MTDEATPPDGAPDVPVQDRDRVRRVGHGPLSLCRGVRKTHGPTSRSSRPCSNRPFLVEDWTELEEGPQERSTPLSYRP